MAINHQQLGGALLLSLVFCALSSMIVVFMMESSLLQVSMLNHALEKRNIRQKCVSMLKEIEQQLADNFSPILSEQAVLQQWIPDTLLWDENKGVSYYRIQIDKGAPDGAKVRLVTTFAVRQLYLADSDREIVRLTNGQSGRFLLEHNSLTFVSSSGMTLKNFNLPLSVDFTPFVITTRNHHQTADALYMGDSQGKLWKLDLTKHTLSEWRLQTYDISALELIEGIVGQPIVGSHPEGKGVLIYFLAQKRGGTDRVLIALSEEEGRDLYVHFVIDDNKRFNQPLLVQDALLIINDDNDLMLYDAWTGEMIEQVSCTVTGSSVTEQSSYGAPKMVNRKPIEHKRLILVQTTSGLKQCEMEVDYKDLGRRSWQENRKL
jgi:hypothetical protein